MGAAYGRYSFTENKVRHVLTICDDGVLIVEENTPIDKGEIIELLQRKLERMQEDMEDLETILNADITGIKRKGTNTVHPV